MSKQLTPFQIWEATAPPEDVVLALINRRQRQILVHSHIYYELDQSTISDFQFDAWCQELVRLQTDHPDLARVSAYAAYFAGFDGSTGYDLPFHLPNIATAARRFLAYDRDKKRSLK